MWECAVLVTQNMDPLGDFDETAPPLMGVRSPWFSDCSCWKIKCHWQLTDYEQNLAMLENLVGKELFYNY